MIGVVMVAWLAGLASYCTTQSTKPVRVSTLSNVVAIAAGDAHSLALTSDGHVYSWGLNTNGQLGLGNSGSGTVAADEEGVVFATGVAPGTATLTADLSGETATMTIAVFAGVSLPAGTARSTAPSRSGIVAADTIFTNDFGGPDALYSIEYATLYGDEKKQATVRSYGVDGMENWFGALPTGDDEIIKKVMPHASGGIVAVLHSYADPPVPAAVIRYSGTDDANWRYESGAWRMQAVTGGNGNVFVVEELLDGMPRLAVLDGQSGAVIARHPLPQMVLATDSSSTPLPVDPVGLTVDADGHARFMLIHGWDRYGADGGSSSHTLDLYDVAPDGTASTTQLDSLSRTPVSSFYYLRPESLTPDSNGVLALFVKAEGAGQDEQWKGKYVGQNNGSFMLPGPWRPTLTSIDGYGIGRGIEATDPLVSRNLRTGSLRWESGAEGDPVIALDGGGANVVDETGALATIDEVGSLTGVDSLDIVPVTYSYGRFHVRDSTNAIVAVSFQPVNDATMFAGGRSGGVGGGASWEPRWYGIWAKSHYVAFPFKHAAIRIVPRNQAHWLATPNPLHVHFTEPKMKRYGDLAFATIGGGPDGQSTPVHTFGYLEARINSHTDIEKDSVDRAINLVNYANENTTISNLFALANGFQGQTLPYELVPISLSDGYNSNSFLHGLLLAANLSRPSWAFSDPGSVSPNEPSLLFPGWGKHVPRVYFGLEP